MIEIALLHHVSPQKGRIGPRAKYAVTPTYLRGYLKNRREWSTEFPGEESEGRCVLLTFDDGYRNNLTNAVPLLDQFGQKAIIFITTGFVDGTTYPYELELASVLEKNDAIYTSGDKPVLDVSTPDVEAEQYQRLRQPLKTKHPKRREAFLERLASLNGYDRSNYRQERFLTWTEVAELDRHPLITIGAHTQTHPVLTRRWPWRAYQEMRQSKRKIEEVLGRRVRHFSYPYGRNNVVVRALARWAGFRWAFTTERRRVDSVEECGAMSIPRIDIQHLI